jgi:hypothetical protein
MQQFKTVHIIRSILKEARIPWYRIQYKLMDEKEWVLLIKSAANHMDRLNYPNETKKIIRQFIFDYEKN